MTRSGKQSRKAAAPRASSNEGAYEARRRRFGVVDARERVGTTRGMDGTRRKMRRFG